ncbi:MAG: CopG family ribbon-helix-helix protein [Candidatus Thalassarchaeaceae archaeon]
MKSSRVAGNSPMVSLRIPEDFLLELDQRIGLEGTRNRSDVIREAIKMYIKNPLSQLGDRIEVNLGPDLSVRMKDFCKIHAESPESVLKQGAKELIRRETIEGDTVDKLLSSRMEKIQMRYDSESNAQ